MFQYDLYTLWAAAKVAAVGGNPYDGAAVAHQMQLIGWPSTEAFGEFRYPPWTLWIFIPLGYLPFQLAQVIWLLLTLGALSACLILTLQLLPKNITSLPKVALVTSVLCFFPALKLILFGQITFISLLGLTLFLVLQEKNRPALAGLALSLTLLKPQLLIPFYAALLVYSWRTKHLTILLGLFIGLVVQAALSVSLYPTIFSVASESIPLIWNRTTNSVMGNLPQFLATMTGWQPLFPISIALGALWGGLIGLRRPVHSLESISLLLPLSLLFAVHAWSHDFILLLLPYLYFALIGIKRYRPLVTVVLMIQWCAAASILFVHIKNERYITLLPLGLLLLALAQAFSRQSHKLAPNNA